MAVTLGLERLQQERRLAGQRVGLVCNPGSIDRQLRHAADLVATESGATLVALFGPQHGFRSNLQDNMIETPHGRDARRGVPVYSLYSETREPTAAMLRGIDALVVDLPDVGTRVYTFIYTMANCLRAASRHGVPVVVCDRPNPIGGIEREGPVLDPAFASFVGQFPIPLRHGLTIGELARLFNGAFDLRADLEVVPMEGWTRDRHADAIGVPWVMPSPNMPTLETAIVYPGTVLFEGTAFSEGRGTTRPFELVGAPWIDAEPFTDRLNTYALPGVRFRPVVFEPTFQKHAGRACGGCQIHVMDRLAFRPVRTAVALLTELRHADAGRFAWRPPPYEYELSRMPIDILYGSDLLRQRVDQAVPLDDIVATWTAPLEAFDRLCRPYLLYA